MRAIDIQGNETDLEAPELEALGFPNSIEVEGLAAATEPPILESLSITPSSVNTTSSSALPRRSLRQLTSSTKARVSAALCSRSSPPHATSRSNQACTAFQAPTPTASTKESS
jgi:hypothetical protein